MDVLPNLPNFQTVNDVVTAGIFCVLPSHVPLPPGPWTHPSKSHMRTATQDFFALVYRACLHFLARQIPPFLPSVDCEIERGSLRVRLFSTVRHLLSFCFILFLRGEIRTRPMTPWFRGNPPHAAPAKLCSTLTKTKIIHERRF